MERCTKKISVREITYIILLLQPQHIQKSSSWQRKRREHRPQVCAVQIFTLAKGETLVPSHLDGEVLHCSTCSMLSVFHSTGRSVLAVICLTCYNIWASTVRSISRSNSGVLQFLIFGSVPCWILLCLLGVFAYLRCAVVAVQAPQVGEMAANVLYSNSSRPHSPKGGDGTPTNNCCNTTTHSHSETTVRAEIVVSSP